MKSIVIIIVFLSSFLFNSCTGVGSSSEKNQPPSSFSPTNPLPDNTNTDEETIRFLEDRVKRDPDDMISYNMLGERYLKRLRETGNLTYLTLAEKAAKESNRILPPENNITGLSLMASTRYASHEFTIARELGEKLIKLQPDQIFSYQVLGDALLELGDYEQATSIFKKMEKLGDSSPNGKFTLAIRVARIEKLHGNIAKGETSLLEALDIALSMKTPSRELIAWSSAQLAEHYFSTGDYNKAENYYKESLKIFPDYFLAIAGLGQVKAAQGDLDQAIKHYEQAVRLIPDLTFVATLGDLYKLTGKEQQAQQQYDLVEQIAKLSTLNGVLYNRSLAIFYANHDIKLPEAYNQAEKEYENRKDIYGADALAWTALKAGKLTEAQAAIKDALKLGTKDAKIFYHAGLIAQAANDNKAAKTYLEQALSLNPHFDPLQALNAKKILDQLKTN